MSTEHLSEELTTITTTLQTRVKLGFLNCFFLATNLSVEELGYKSKCLLSPKTQSCYRNAQLFKYWVIHRKHLDAVPMAHNISVAPSAQHAFRHLLNDLINSKTTPVEPMYLRADSDVLISIATFSMTT